MKNNLCKLILILTACLSVSLSINAAKSDGAIHYAQQPDGTTLAFQLLGDEHFSWYQTPDGVLLIKQDKTFYVGTVTSTGTLESSGIMAHNSDARSAEEQTAISLQDRDRFFKQTDTEASIAKIGFDENTLTSISNYPDLNKFCPHSGTVKVPIILMQYTDEPFSVADTDEGVKTVFEEYFNGTTTTPYSNDTKLQGYGSVAQYFKDASNGKLNFEFDLYGPYTTVEEHDYYGHSGYHEIELATEAVSKADDDIDFSQYDSDNNGKVDMVYILYAGTGANLSGDNSDFWPKCWYGQSISTDEGKTINVIGGTNELQKVSGNLQRAGIGVTCHEMSHGLGMPDLYWTLGTVPTHTVDNVKYPDYDNCGPEMWDLMDGGENTGIGIWPCEYAAWEKEAMGWVTPVELTKPSTVTVYPLSDTEKGTTYRVTNPANNNEYYMIEVFKKTGWNYYTCNYYGSGLMITHVNMSSSGLSMKCNDVYGKPNVTLLPADGYILAGYSIDKTIPYNGSVVTITSSDYLKDLYGDPYPYPGSESTSGNWNKNVTSVAAYKNYTGDDMVSNYPITDIVKNSDGSITFNFMGGTPSVTLNSKQFATFSCATDVVIKTEGVKAYKASVDDDVITLTALNGYIPAGTGVLLYGENVEAETAINFQLPDASYSKADVTGNKLQPTTTATTDVATKPTTGTIWVLGDGNKLLKYTGSEFIANRAYLVHELGSNSKMSIVFAGDPTGITDVTTNTHQPSTTTQTYNLAGQRVNANAHGWVIKNGKKYFNK